MRWSRLTYAHHPQAAAAERRGINPQTKTLLPQGKINFLHFIHNFHRTGLHRFGADPSSCMKKKLCYTEGSFPGQGDIGPGSGGFWAMKIESVYPAGFIPVPYIFIDRYMCAANGEFVKTYLLLLRLAGEEGLTVSLLADRLIVEGLSLRIDLIEL